MQLVQGGRAWTIGTAADVAWLDGRPTGVTVATAVPPVFEAYATFHWGRDVPVAEHERAVVDALVAHTTEQPWWLGYLDTGAHDVVVPQAPRVHLYWQWPYVLVLAGPEQALGCRTGTMRHDGALPDLLFPVDRSWVVSALWDDGWTCVGGPAEVVDALVADPRTHARRVRLDEDALPPGLARD